MIRYSSGIFDSKRVVLPAAPSYPTSGLIDRWTFENTLTGDNGNTWAADGGLTYDYVDGIVAGTKGVRQTNAWVEYGTGRLYLNESIFPAFDSASVSATLSLWCKVPTCTTYVGIMGKGNLHTQPAWKFVLLNNSTGGNWTSWQTGNFAGDNVMSISIANNTWHHFLTTIVKTGATTGQQYCYLDNTQVGSFTVNFPQSASTDWQIFRLWQNDPAPQYTVVDQVYMYNRVLDSTERAQLYNSGNGV